VQDVSAGEDRAVGIWIIPNMSPLTWDEIRVLEEMALTEEDERVRKSLEMTVERCEWALLRNAED